MRIDAHQHFWSYQEGSPDFDWIDASMQNIKRSFLPEDLEPLLGAAAMDGCIAVQAAQTDQETTFLLQLAERFDYILGVVGWVELRSPSVGQQLDRLMKHRKFRGVRHIVQAEPASILEDPDFRRGIGELTTRGLAYDLLIHQGQLPEAVRFVADHPEQPIVLDHVGKPLIARGELEPWATHLKELARYPNCYCKVSGLVTEANWAKWAPQDLEPYLDRVFEYFPADRLLFGSDWPVCLVAAAYEQLVRVIEKYLTRFDSAMGAAVFGDNAKLFYRLS